MSLQAIPRECLLLCVSMAFTRNDYWSSRNYLQTLAGVRLLCKFFAETLTWEQLMASLWPYSNSFDDFKTNLDDLRHEEETTITKTDAKKLYCLTEKDLEHVACESRRNPHYRRGPQMKLFQLKDLVVAAQLKHGTKVMLNEHKRKMNVASWKRKRTLEAGKQQRRDELSSQLAEHGLKIREDSRLCKNFVQLGRGNLNSIVTTMVEMDFYFKHTTYEQKYQRICDEDWSLGRRIDRDEVSKSAKIEALRDFVKANDHCPDFVPLSLRSQFDNN